MSDYGIPPAPARDVERVRSMVSELTPDEIDAMSRPRFLVVVGTPEIDELLAQMDDLDGGHA